MLTGDAKKVADQVAKELGLDEVLQRTASRRTRWRRWKSCCRKKSEKEKLAFVGDGINDAPVLGRADIGIAMGAMGSDAAIEAADVVLMDDDPMKIAKAIKISRKCLGIVYQNIVFAIGIKLICLVLGALGNRQYVACHLCGCGRHDHRGSQRDPGALCEKSLTAVL